jgi:hypothetical protein
MSPLAAPTVDECIDALSLGIVRARFVVGWRWTLEDQPPPLTLSSEERRDLGLLLDALHNLPDYIRRRPTEPIFASIARRALEQFAAVHYRMLTAIVGRPDDPSPPQAAQAAATSRLVDNDFDDSPFGPAHEA